MKKLLQKFLIGMFLISSFTCETQIKARITDDDIFFEIPLLIGLCKLSYDGAQQILPAINQYIAKTTQQRPKSIPRIDVGRITLTGEINFNSVTKCIKELDQFKNDDAIKGIVLCIASGGGAATASSLLHQEIKNFAKQKPLIVITPECESGAYYVACAADWIIAPEGAGIGSIGAWRFLEHFTDTIKGKLGDYKGEMECEYIKAGKYKVVGNAYQNLGEEGRKYHQNLVDEQYNVFCFAVAENRNLNLAEKEIWADGQEFIAPTALKLGLIDQIGGWSDAKEKIVELIKERNTNATGRINIVVPTA